MCCRVPSKRKGSFPSGRVKKKKRKREKKSFCLVRNVSRKDLGANNAGQYLSYPPIPHKGARKCRNQKTRQKEPKPVINSQNHRISWEGPTRSPEPNSWPWLGPSQVSPPREHSLGGLNDVLITFAVIY